MTGTLPPYMISSKEERPDIEPIGFSNYHVIRTHDGAWMGSYEDFETAKKCTEYLMQNDLAEAGRELEKYL